MYWRMTEAHQQVICECQTAEKAHHTEVFGAGWRRFFLHFISQKSTDTTLIT
jgi:hypothetical protein